MLCTVATAVVRVDSFVAVAGTAAVAGVEVAAAPTDAADDVAATATPLGFASKIKLGIPVAVPLMAAPLLCATFNAPEYRGG